VSAHRPLASAITSVMSASPIGRTVSHQKRDRLAQTCGLCSACGFTCLFRLIRLSDNCSTLIAVCVDEVTSAVVRSVNDRINSDHFKIVIAKLEGHSKKCEPSTSKLFEIRAQLISRCPRIVFVERSLIPPI
jgi:hypothetical protein